jgi:S1-C subfamily serine protease
MRLHRILITLIALVLLDVCAARAARLVLKDGTVLEGVVIRQQDGYWIKTPDGHTRTVSDDDVASATMDTPEGQAPAAEGSSQAFAWARGRAEDAPTAVAAVSVWQQFIDKHPDSADLPQARAELARWKSLAADGAEKIYGKWVSGEERRRIIQQAADLTRQALDMFEHKQTLSAIDLLQQSLRIYPNSFLTNFALGDVAMFQKNYDMAVDYYRTASRLSPQSAAAVNNLAVATFFNKRWEAGITGFQQAAQIEDSKMVAQNLVTALALAPQDVRTMPSLRQVVQASNLLALKYQISGPSPDFFLMSPPTAPDDHFKGGDGPSGYGWSGTGFFISDDGLILTNRHVAAGAKTLLVLCGEEQSSADVIAIDDQYDLALIRIKPKGKEPFVHLSTNDTPHEGADCTVLGFPLIQKLGADIKITRGIISSDSSDAGGGADVLIDAKVNPGNSGGPIIDKFGNVMAIVCMKSVSTQMEESYGIGISAGHIREFLARHHVTATPADTDTPTLSTEDIVTKVKPTTVCILATP